MDEQGALLAPVEQPPAADQGRKHSRKKRSGTISQDVPNDSSEDSVKDTSKILTRDCLKELLSKSINDSSGIALIQGIALAKKFVDEEPPSSDEDIHIAWVEIHLSGGKLLADPSTASVIA